MRITHTFGGEVTPELVQERAPAHFLEREHVGIERTDDLAQSTLGVLGFRIRRTEAVRVWRSARV